MRFVRMAGNSLIPSFDHGSVSLALLYQAIMAAALRCSSLSLLACRNSRTLARGMVHSSVYDVLTLLQINLSRTLPARILCLLPVSGSFSD